MDRKTKISVKDNGNRNSELNRKWNILAFYKIAITIGNVPSFRVDRFERRIFALYELDWIESANNNVWLEREKAAAKKREKKTEETSIETEQNVKIIG